MLFAPAAEIDRERRTDGHVSAASAAETRLAASPG
jgi:hypothetical protein